MSVEKENKELGYAWDFVEHTGTSVFLTGKAGTGKTTFLRQFVAETQKRFVIVAPTGVAAVNARGVTIHSFFQLPFSPYVPHMTYKEKFAFSQIKRNILKTLDLLIIDEISMVRSDLLDAIDAVLRRFRNPLQPFGGVQLLMIGDLQQLTPVVTDEDAMLLNRHYATPYFFDSHALAKVSYVTIELKKVYRQQNETFLRILNHVRDGAVTADDLAALNARYEPNFVPPKDAGYIRLTTHNAMADHYNEQQLAAIEEPAFCFAAEIRGTFPEYSYPTSEHLVLKKGAQVMFVRNDASPAHQYYNGRIGQVKAIDDDCILVHCEGDEFDISVERQVWENTRYVINEKTKEIEPEVQGAFMQYPLRLAWAITIHKSQGLTFEHAIIDAGASFASGQVYVALSRCKTLEGLVLASPLHAHAIMNDHRVDAYIEQQEHAAEESIVKLPYLKQDYYRQQLLELFNFRDLMQAEEALNRAAIEWLHAYPKLQMLHKATLQSMQTQVADVAAKWLKFIAQQSFEALQDEVFVERMQKSVGYFIAQLNTYLRPLLVQTKEAKVGNKQGVERLQTTYAELRVAYLSKYYLLTAILKAGFQVESYLKLRQKCFLEAIDEVESSPEPTKKRRQRTTEKPKAEKPAKVNTREITRQLFEEGKTIGDIAVERSLTVSTIEGHLARYVAQGELSAVAIIGQERYDCVNPVVERLGTSTERKVLKEHCPEHITYGDILIVLAEKEFRAKK